MSAFTDHAMATSAGLAAHKGNFGNTLGDIYFADSYRLHGGHCRHCEQSGENYWRGGYTYSVFVSSGAATSVPVLDPTGVCGDGGGASLFRPSAVRTGASISRAIFHVCFLEAATTVPIIKCTQWLAMVSLVTQ